MIHNLNNTELTSKSVIETVLCSVLEDVNNHFDEYANEIFEDYSELTEEELNCIDKWKYKVISKINTQLRKKDKVND